ncbi:hypothetical protein P3S68_022098 [Capsicum galapagoense]
MSIFGSTATTNTNPNKSIEVQQPPADSVTSLCFSPKANLLVATSWDNQVRCWEVMGSGTNTGTVPKATISHEQPVYAQLGRMMGQLSSLEVVTSKLKCGLYLVVNL